MNETFFWVMDRIVIVVCLAGAFIRTGNFMNSEILGLPTDSGNGVVFAKSVNDILKFTTEVEYSGDMHAEIWFQKYYENQFHTPHTHGTIGYSSVLYINFDKRIHKGTRFLAPFNNPEGNEIEFAPDVDEGSFIFFPSYLNHYALPNKSDAIRIIMSMNIRKK